MISIDFQPVQLPEAIKNKQKAAVYQMQQLVEKLSVGNKFSLLSNFDRHILQINGYAPDLVDNVIFLTQRLPATQNGTAYKDKVIVGFTAAAFDSSLYACDELVQSCQALTEGNCAYCETPLMVSGNGIVSHHRPVWGYCQTVLPHRKQEPHKCTEQQSIQLIRPGFYWLAYEQSNLMYTCIECSHYYKGIQYPLLENKKKQSSDEKLSSYAYNEGFDKRDSQSLLVNPYHDNPRDWIRFHPINGCAYPFDQVAQFYKDWKQYSKDDVQQLIWRNPEWIPDQRDCHGNSISNTDVDSNFKKWCATHFAGVNLSKGRVTIDILGLNRPVLINSRLTHLYSLNAHYQLNKDNANYIGKWLDDLSCIKSKRNQKNKYLPLMTYRSFSIDVLNRWIVQDKILKNKHNTIECNAHRKQEIKQVNSIASKRREKSHVVTEPNNEVSSVTVVNNDFPDFNYVNHIDLYTLKAKIPLWVKSSFMYMVLEKDLMLVNKRRLVCLHSSDKGYCNDLITRAVFLDVDWQQDYDNPIQIYGEYLTWQSSFSELLTTQPLALVALFARNEIWVEGKYKALG
ncbi:hypothetical protein [Zooshikella sp. RANM57]|uniref:hypothetical protein n=1 Tax=Zooshikella sp. RANM57 TaxID=3425863 RepID=UPI003D6FBFF2